jgi:hypothetical protein
MLIRGAKRRDVTGRIQTTGTIGLTEGVGIGYYGRASADSRAPEHDAQ